MLSSKVLNDAKLRARVRRVSILVCGTLAFVPILMGLDCIPITPPPGCTDDVGCDDGVDCTADSCDLSGTTGVCVNADNCTGGETCNTTNGACEGTPCVSDVDCDNGLICDGTETCDTTANACIAGVAVDCDDADACTVDACVAADGSCTHTTVVCTAPETCSPVSGDCVTPCTADADCNNGDFCDGVETCDTVNNACVPGTDPCTTGQTCDEVEDTCGAIGLTFTLTLDSVNPDAITGTIGDDTFEAPVGTLQTADVIVGNGGTDTMNTVMTGNTASGVTLISMDIMNVTTLNTVTFAAGGTADIGIWNILAGSTGAFTMTASEADPVFTLGSGFAKALNVTLANVAGGTDKIDVTLNGTAKGCIVGTTSDAALETLNIDVPSDSWLSALTPGTPAAGFFGVAAPVGAVVITGAGKLTLDGGNATTLGADTYTLTGFTGNMGISPIPQAAAATLTLNFVALGLPRITNYIVNDLLTANHTLTFNAADTNVTVDVNSIAALDLMGNLTVTQGAGATDSLTVNLGGAGMGMGAIAAAATEQLTVNSGGTTANAIANVTGTSGSVINTEKLTVLGTQNLTLGNVTTNIVDAATFSGTLSLTSLTTMTVNCGSGACTVTGSGAVDVQNGGAGADTLSGLGGIDTLDGNGGIDRIIGGAGIDAVTGGTETDTFVFNTTVLAANANNISDFAAGAAGDKIAIDAATFTDYTVAGTVTFVTGGGAVAGLTAGVDNVVIRDTAANILLVTPAAGAQAVLAIATDTGDIYYDANGNFTAAAVVIGNMTAAEVANLVAANFVIE